MKKLLILPLLLIAASLVAQTGGVWSDVFKRTRLPVYSAPSDKLSIPLDSVFARIKPVVIAAAYFEPGNILMAGIGIAYENIKWDATTQVNKVNWSAGLYGFAGGSVVPTTPAALMSIGAGFGFLNNNIVIGPAYNLPSGTLPKGQLGAFLSTAINIGNN